jgi:hypothetical protein
MFEYAFTMKIIQNGKNDKSISMCTYEMIEAMFCEFGYYLSGFRKDQKKKHAYYSARAFITLQLLYVMRWEQLACALCDVEIPDKTFGAIGFENDHIWENVKEDQEEGTKEFLLCLNKGDACLNRSVIKIIMEFAKTHLVCADCHNWRVQVSKGWSYELPSSCIRTYSEDFRSFSQIINLRNGESVQELQKEIFRNLPKLSCEDITSKVAQLHGFNVRDVIYVGRDEWNAKPNYLIGRMFMNILKRMTGGCFLCSKNATLSLLYHCYQRSQSLSISLFFSKLSPSNSYTNPTNQPA